MLVLGTSLKAVATLGKGVGLSTILLRAFFAGAI